MEAGIRRAGIRRAGLPRRRGGRVTPGQAAKWFAARYPEFTGVLKVVSLTPAGRGGWKTKKKRTTFYVDRGVAVQTRRVWAARVWDSHRRQESYRNGICPVCGRIELKPVIMWAFDAAGDPVLACPDCREAHELVLDNTRFLNGRAGRLATHDRYRVDVVVDIREVQEHRESEPAVRWEVGRE